MAEIVDSRLREFFHRSFEGIEAPTTARQRLLRAARVMAKKSAKTPDVKQAFITLSFEQLSGQLLFASPERKEADSQ